MRAAVIGCGHVSREHLRALGHLEEVDVAAVCDLDEQRRTEVAHRFGIARTYGDADELLARERPDVVHVLTPPQSHRDVTIAALARGCHVLVEKPMAVNAVEAEEMLVAARQAGTTLSVCHNFLFHPEVRRARKLIDEGRLGTILSVDILWRMSNGVDAGRYTTCRWMRSMPGSYFHESAPHAVYIERELLGRLTPLTVVVRRRRERPVPAGDLRALLDGENGLGAIWISLVGRPLSILVHVAGTESSLVIDLVHDGVVEHRRDSSSGRWWRPAAGLERGTRIVLDAARVSVEARAGRRDRGHALLIRSFYEALAAGIAPPVTGEDGKETVEVLDRLWEMLEER